MLSGASGAGKSTVVPFLIERLAGTCIVFDADWLIDPLRGAGSGDDIDWEAFRDVWLHVTAGVVQNGLAALLVGPFIPEHVEHLRGRARLGDIHFAVLDCPDDIRRRRIEERPAWRSRDVAAQIEFGQWLRTNLAPVFDTEDAEPEGTAAAVAEWAIGRISNDDVPC